MFVQGNPNPNKPSKASALQGSQSQPTDENIPIKYLYRSKNEIYSNGNLLAPDGQLLCTCSLNKLKWYCVKGLGGQSIFSQILKKQRIYYAYR